MSAPTELTFQDLYDTAMARINTPGIENVEDISDIASGILLCAGELVASNEDSLKWVPDAGFSVHLIGAEDIKTWYLLVNDTTGEQQILKVNYAKYLQAYGLQEAKLPAYMIVEFAKNHPDLVKG